MDEEVTKNVSHLFILSLVMNPRPSTPSYPILPLRFLRQVYVRSLKVHILQVEVPLRNCLFNDIQLRRR